MHFPLGGRTRTLLSLLLCDNRCSHIDEGNATTRRCCNRILEFYLRGLQLSPSCQIRVVVARSHNAGNGNLRFLNAVRGIGTCLHSVPSSILGTRLFAGERWFLLLENCFLRFVDSDAKQTTVVVYPSVSSFTFPFLFLFSHIYLKDRRRSCR